MGTLFYGSDRIPVRIEDRVPVKLDPALEQLNIESIQARGIEIAEATLAHRPDN